MLIFDVKTLRTKRKEWNGIEESIRIEATEETTPKDRHNVSGLILAADAQKLSGSDPKRKSDEETFVSK